MRRVAILILVTFQSVASSNDARLKELGAFLIPMRAKPFADLEARGATPQFTTIKHLLRDWIESRLEQLPAKGAAAKFEDQLNRGIQRAGVVCRIDEGPAYVPDCPELTERGFLSPIKVKVEMDLLIIQTGVGLQNCGFDESAYAYRWSGRWRRFWQSEQDDYAEPKYRPQTLRAVLMSPTTIGGDADPDEHLILTLGTESWCTSSFHPVYYRAWQIKSGFTEPKLLLDESDDAVLYFAEPIRGSVGTANGLYHAADEVWIEYTVPGLDAVTREEVRHYRLNGDKLERIDPVALGPRDFVDQWVRHRWDEKTGWSDPHARGRLQQWLPKPDGDGLVFARTLDSTRRCEQTPNSWQVEIKFEGRPKAPLSIYFLVNWQPPFHFAMADFSDRPWPDCNQPDFVADHFLTLFR